ncbi:hypothetical protein VTL71DRAFT_10378 [Oculimacula yallundae]|uniref:Uncharacterized protein n=1 Tax=Oculimacula yallundae TaxID=86028 RepID=A0ABR4CVE9_9HELO
MEGFNFRRLAFQYAILLTFVILNMFVMYYLDAFRIGLNHLQTSGLRGMADLSQEFVNTATPIQTGAPAHVSGNYATPIRTASPTSVPVPVSVQKMTMTVNPPARSCPIPGFFPTYDYEIAILADNFAFKINNIEPCILTELAKSIHRFCAKNMVLSDLKPCNNLPCWSFGKPYLLGHRKCNDFLQGPLDSCTAAAFDEELGPLLVKRVTMEAGFGGIGSYYAGGEVFAKRGEPWIRFGFTDDSGAFFHGSGLHKGAPPYHREIGTLLLQILLLLGFAVLCHAKHTTITLAAGYYKSRTSMYGEHTTPIITTTNTVTTVYGPTPVLLLTPTTAAIPIATGNTFRDWIERKCRGL